MTSSVAPRRDRRGPSLATRGAPESWSPTVFKALHSLASQLLALGWILRVARTAWDCQDGAPSDCSQAFSPTRPARPAESNLSIVQAAGEHELVAHMDDLVDRLRRVPATNPRASRNAVSTWPDAA